MLRVHLLATMQARLSTLMVGTQQVRESMICLAKRQGRLDSVDLQNAVVIDYALIKLIV